MSGRRASQLTLAILLPTVILAGLEFGTITFGLAPAPLDALVVWNPRQDAGLNHEEGEFRYSPHWLWEPRPGVHVRGAPIADDAHRGPALDPQEKRGIRIAVFGDSTTYGFGLAEEYSWGRALEKYLRSFGVKAEVINFGVIGYSLEQGYRVYLGKAREYQPDVVIAAFGAVNDHVPDLLTDRGKIDLVSHPIYRTHRFLTRYSTFRLMERLINGKPEPREVDEEDVTPRVPLDQFSARLVDFDRAVKEDGGQFVVVCPPRRAAGEKRLAPTIEYTHAIHEVTSREQIIMAEVRDAFRSADDDEGLFLDEWHPTIKGHRLYAITIGQAMVAAGMFPELKKNPKLQPFLGPTSDDGE